MQSLSTSIALLTAIASTGLQAQGVGPITFESYELPNGLQVVLAPDRSSQVVTVDVWYQAGSREEPQGKAGLARLFEHLMFAGSANVPAGGHAALVDEVGGRVTADVDEERARFGESVPSNRLGLALWLEAERMGSLAINDTSVAQARRDLLDDLSQRVNQEPYAAAIMDALSSLYDSSGCPGYAHPPIGRAGSITGLTIADAQAFFRERYTPQNARLVVAGDFAPATARQLIAQYFAGLPRASGGPRAVCTPTSTPGAQARTVADRSIGRLAVGHFHRLPAHDHTDIPALELLGLILSQGPGSRLATAVARDARAAIATQGGILGDRRGPQAFGLFAIAAPAMTADSLGALLAGQAAWAAGNGITEADLTRAKNIYRATAISGRERPVDIADHLHHAALFHGSAEDINAEVARVLAVTVADLRRVAQTWLIPGNALTLVISPEAAP
jgi:zinc protease